MISKYQQCLFKIPIEKNSRFKIPIEKNYCFKIPIEKIVVSPPDQNTNKMIKIPIDTFIIPMKGIKIPIDTFKIPTDPFKIPIYLVL